MIARGFLLIEVIIAIALMSSFAGIITYYYIYNVYYWRDINTYCCAVTQATEVVQNKHYKNKQINSDLHKNTIMCDKQSIIIPELPLKKPYNIRTITITWESLNGCLYTYRLTG